MVKIRYIPTSQLFFRTLLYNANSIKNIIGGGSVDDISYFQSSTPYIKGSGCLGHAALVCLRNI